MRLVMIMVKCHGGMSPAVLVCVHVFNGTATEYMRLPNDRVDIDEMDDYFCTECIRKGQHAISEDDLTAGCLHCVRLATETMADITPQE
jgi:hypothetical protein